MGATSGVFSQKPLLQPPCTRLASKALPYKPHTKFLSTSDFFLPSAAHYFWSHLFSGQVQLIPRRRNFPFSLRSVIASSLPRETNNNEEKENKTEILPLQDTKVLACDFYASWLLLEETKRQESQQKVTGTKTSKWIALHELSLNALKNRTK